MDFAYSAKVEDLRAQAAGFMDAHVQPADAAVEARRSRPGAIRWR